MAQSKKFWVEKLGEGWVNALKETLRSPYMDKLTDFLNVQYGKQKIHPSREDVFNAFKLCPWEDLKVVILGLDPAWDANPNGLAFGTKVANNYPNIALYEIRTAVEQTSNSLCLDFDFSLQSWAKQGVLLLNTSLTAPEFKTGEHKKPWNKFTLSVIQAINDYRPGTIFIIWGDENNELLPMIGPNNEIIKDVHPVTVGKQHATWCSISFKECNDLLISKYGTEHIINWGSEAM